MEKISTAEALSALTAKIVGEISALPYVKTEITSIKQGKGDPEELVVLLSDLQIGHKSPTTNAAIISKRCANLASRVLKIVSLHRKAYPIKKLHVFVLGDIVHNEAIGKTVGLDELEMVLSDQMFKIAVPVLERFLLTLLPHFQEGIEVYTIAGNHGKLSKENADSSNMDNVVYRFLAERLRNYKEINFHSAYDKFYQMVEIMGWKFLLIHGDQIKMTLTLPFYGVTTRAMRLQGAVGRFDYLCLGHFHTANILNWQDSEILMNGTFVSDDQWVLQKLGMGTSPKQLVFGIHPNQGITFRYLVKLD